MRAHSRATGRARGSVEFHIRRPALRYGGAANPDLHACPTPPYRPPGTPVTPPPHPTLRRGLWALPLLLSLAFVAVVLAWLRSNERADLELQRLELISDALSLDAQVSARIEREAQLLRDLAARPGRVPNDAPAFAAMPEVQQGLHRFWVSLTWLDTANRIRAHLPGQAPRPSAADASVAQSVGLSARAEHAWRREAAWRSAMEDSLPVGLRARPRRPACLREPRAHRHGRFRARGSRRPHAADGLLAGRRHRGVDAAPPAQHGRRGPARRLRSALAAPRRPGCST